MLPYWNTKNSMGAFQSKRWNALVASSAWQPFQLWPHFETKYVTLCLVLVVLCIDFLHNPLGWVFYWMFVPLLFMDLWLCLCLVEMKGILLKRLPKVPVLLLLLLLTLQPIWLLSLPFWRFSMESCRGLDQWLENQNLVLRY